MLKNELKLYFPSQVELKLTGYEEGDYKDKKETNEFYKYEDILIGPGSKHPEKDWLGSKKIVKTKLEEGKHVYPFEIQLPELLPGCFESSEARTCYDLRVDVISANKKMSNLFTLAKIPIGGSLYDLNYIGNHTKEIQMKESNAENAIGKINIGQINAKESKTIEDKIEIPEHITETIQKTKIPINKKEFKVGQIIRLRFHGEVSMAKDIEFTVPLIVVRRKKKEEKKEEKKEQVKEEKKEEKKEVKEEKKDEKKEVKKEEVEVEEIFELQSDTDKKIDNYKKFGYVQNFNFTITKEELMEKKGELEHVNKNTNLGDPLDEVNE